MNSPSPPAVIVHTKPGMLSTIRRKACSFCRGWSEEFISLSRRELILGVEDLPSKRSGGERNGSERQLKSHPQKHHCRRGSRSSEWHPDTTYSASCSRMAGASRSCVGEDHSTTPQSITDQSVLLYTWDARTTIRSL